MINFTAGAENKEVFRIIMNIDKLMRRGLKNGARKAGQTLVKETAREIRRKPKSGKVVRIKIGRGRTRRHVTSAPGETFANTTGLWIKTLGYQVLGSNAFAFGFGEGNGNPPPPQAKDLEFGTKKAAARPALQNAIMMAEETIARHLKDEVAVLLKC